MTKASARDGATHGRAWPAPLDGDALLALPPGTRARRELLPLFHGVLEREGRLGALDPPTRALARRAYYATLARSARLRAGLAALLDDAAAVGAEVLPLKGALLAFAVYPDPALRPMSDLDVAVRAADLAPLGARLEARGYRRYGDGRRRFHLSFTHQVLYLHEREPPVELHARLLHELGVDGAVAPLWERAVPVTLVGRTVRAPAWEAHLVYVAVHAATHGFADSPLWLADLAHLLPLVAAPGEVAAEARRRRAVAATHLAFALARRYLPSLAWPAVDAPAAAGLRTAALALALGPDPLARVPSIPSLRLARAAATDRPRDLLRSFAHKTTLHLAERLLEGNPGPDRR